MKLILLCLVLLMACLCVYAQAPPTPIRGNVLDSSTNAVLEEASVFLSRLPDREPVQRLRNGRNGFTLRPPASGRYELIVSYLGYLPDTLTLTIGPNDTVSYFLRVRLAPSAQALMQVVVRSSIPPVIVRNDTVAFNAGAYPVRPNATLEDLIRKMPGIEIDKDGNVTLQGKKVDKIYIDGKEFFLNDVKTATQNLPADLVAQIEAFDSQSEQGRLTGVKDNTGGKTINIKLKNNRKTGYFGNAYAGTGSNGAYSVGATATSLSTPRLLFFNANTNDINNQFTGTENRTGPGAGGVQTLTNANLNYKDNWGDHFKVTFNGGFSEVHNSLLQTTNRTTFLTDSSLQEVQFNKSITDNKNGRASAVIEYGLDSMNTLIYRGTYLSQQSSSLSQDTMEINAVKPTNSYLSNRGKTDNSSTTNGHNFSNSLDYQRKFEKKGRTLYLNFSEFAVRQDQPSNIFSLVDAFDSLGNRWQHNIVNQRSTQMTKGDTYRGTLVFTEPIGPHEVFDMNYRISSSSNRSDKSSADYDSATGRFDLPDSTTSNHFLTHTTTQWVNMGFNATEGKLRYQLGLSAQFTNLTNTNYSLNDSQLVQHFTNLAPRASLIYTVGKGKNLNLYYSGNSTSPGIDQLQPIPDLTNPFLVKLGNPGLQQQFDHNISLSYTTFNAQTLRNTQVYISGNYTENKITSATTLLAGGVQQIQYININGTYHFNGNLVYGFPLGSSRKGNGSISASGQYGRDINFVNGEQDVSTVIGASSGLTFNYHPVQKLFFNGSVAFNYNGATYSLYKAQNTHSYMQDYNLDGSFELPLSITIVAYYTLLVISGQSGLPAQRSELWNAAIYKSFLRDHSLQIRFSAFDLLNSASSYTQTVTQNYIETRNSNLPGRLFLVSLGWHFSKFLEKH